MVVQHLTHGCATPDAHTGQDPGIAAVASRYVWDLTPSLAIEAILFCLINYITCQVLYIACFVWVPTYLAHGI